MNQVCILNVFILNPFCILFQMKYMFKYSYYKRSYFKRKFKKLKINENIFFVCGGGQLAAAVPSTAPSGYSTQSPLTAHNNRGCWAQLVGLHTPTTHNTLYCGFLCTACLFNSFNFFFFLYLYYILFNIYLYIYIY